MTPEHAEGPVQRVHTDDDLRRWSDNVPYAQEDQLSTVRSARSRAVHNARLDSDGAFVQNHGDGDLVRWPYTVSGLDLLDRYVPTLAVELGRANERRTEEARSRMRMAAVEGVSRRVGDGLVGAAPITAKRFLDCRQSRAALELLPHRPLVVVIDDRLHSLVEQRLGSLEERNFIPIQVEIPDKGFSESAWLTMPGCDAAELELLRKELAAGQPEPTPESSGVVPARRPRDAEEPGDDDSSPTPGDTPEDRQRRRMTPALATIIGAAIAALAAVAVAMVPFLPWNTDKSDSTTPWVDITGTCTAPGDQLAVSSGGFTPNKQYTVTVTEPGGRPYDLSYGSSGTATAQGALHTGWTCEAKDASGVYSIAVTDTTTGKTAHDTFQVDKVD